jgi:hypothetical protein
MNERRSATRFRLSLPLTVQYANEEVQVFTTDVSARGVAFKVNTAFDEKILGLELTFPPEVTLSASLRVRCYALVVRVQNSSPSCTEVAASIQKYEFLETHRD